MGTEEYLVKLKYFDLNDGYWKYEEIRMRGYKDKKSHKQAGLDACIRIESKNIKHPEVMSVIYC